jgi:hypothetical protein
MKVTPRRRRRQSGPKAAAADALRMSDQLSEKLDDWAAQQPDRPDRNAAILRLLQIGITRPVRKRLTHPKKG